MLDGQSGVKQRNDWPGPREMMHFCRPDETDGQDSDNNRLLRSAVEFDIPFEGQMLKGYRWGEGETVLLVHGWNSRAAHLAFLARSLARSGFSAVAFDGPAHGSSQFNSSHPRTSLPEFCRAIYHVANRIGNIYAVAGHSFGGAAAAFCLAGQANLAGYRIAAEKLVMISAPPGIRRMVEHYCRDRGFQQGAADALIRQLEEEFPLCVDDYEIHEGLGRIDADVLVVHDEDDKEIALQDARDMVAGHPGVTLAITTGEGHRRILVSRGLLRRVKRFLQPQPLAQ